MSTGAEALQKRVLAWTLYENGASFEGTARTAGYSSASVAKTMICVIRRDPECLHREKKAGGKRRAAAKVAKTDWAAIARENAREAGHG